MEARYSRSQKRFRLHRHGGQRWLRRQARTEDRTASDQGRRDADEGADRGRDRQRRHGRGGIDRRRRARHRRQDRRLYLARRAASRSGESRNQDAGRSQGQECSHFLARLAARFAVSRHVGRHQCSVFGREAGDAGRRSRPLQVIGCRHHRCRRGIERVRGDHATDDPRAGERKHGSPEIHSLVRRHQQQGVGLAP